MWDNWGTTDDPGRGCWGEAVQASTGSDSARGKAPPDDDMLKASLDRFLAYSWVRNSSGPSMLPKIRTPLPTPNAPLNACSFLMVPSTARLWPCNNHEPFWRRLQNAKREDLGTFFSSLSLYSLTNYLQDTFLITMNTTTFCVCYETARRDLLPPQLPPAVSVSVVVSRIFVNSKTTTLEVRASIDNMLPINNSRMDVPTYLFLCFFAWAPNSATHVDRSSPCLTPHSCLQSWSISWTGWNVEGVYWSLRFLHVVVDFIVIHHHPNQ